MNAQGILIRDGVLTIDAVNQAIADAEQRGREAERAAVVKYLYAELGDSFDQQAIDLTMGKHLGAADE